MDEWLGFFLGFFLALIGLMAAWFLPSWLAGQPTTASHIKASPLDALATESTAPTGSTSLPHLGGQIEGISMHVAECSECKAQLVQSMLSFGTLVLDVPGNLLPSILAKWGTK